MEQNQYEKAADQILQKIKSNDFRKLDFVQLLKAYFPKKRNRWWIWLLVGLGVGVGIMVLLIAAIFSGFLESFLGFG